MCGGSSGSKLVVVEVTWFGARDQQPEGFFLSAFAGRLKIREEVGEAFFKGRLHKNNTANHFVHTLTHLVSDIIFHLLNRSWSSHG